MLPPRPANASILNILLKRRSAMVAAVGIYAGLGLLWYGEQANLPLSILLERYGWTVAGAVTLMSSLMYLGVFLLSNNSEHKFIDVDDRATYATQKMSVEANSPNNTSLEESDSINTSLRSINDFKINNSPEKQQESNELDSFEKYFDSIRSTLEEKAAAADQKASILLDKGTAYSKGGISFFILSIFIWQFLAWIKGFETQFIYGIASCSVLFIFIEFLSAWFLKQYRQFVDTSTYLIKVKSIFDRYMLAYLVLKEASGETSEKRLEVLPLLKDELRWPETYLLKNTDIGFAKEALETMSHVIKNMKDASKDSNSKP